MIENIVVGDITSSDNSRDIIIGMNTGLEDVTGIGRRFVRNLIPAAALELGSVISFDFDEKRKLQMIICHVLGRGGWTHADEHIRFGMDYINHLNDTGRKYSIVQVGTGRIGKRDGADHALIRKAMADSYLKVNLHVFDGIPMHAVAEMPQPLRAISAWHPTHGQLQMAA